ncbi:DUF1129 domain-containing protein [Levilactobacillus zymae]|uniref:Membrane protein n=1 Tax=Levilactobacillus zymae TaxID=267363 RepID=A0A1Y6K190_9LACO|nr:DUF1129 domain-containing protein [Levilactobacillus zymae]KRL09578.1 hypothetical protein FD38_GL002174 [Levilactobacillus zymae DSM 19395]QFR62282.1 DUF1129 family protein [Levilactobacillus zymae]SMS15053.1 hypothetical protein LZ3411_2003 [Levilactobacillus zymae]SMS15122.1 Integral membrane protein [Levilactobacillus zymae]GEO71948.1 membrane protein [Levilactobacillus zymae]
MSENKPKSRPRNADVHQNRNAVATNERTAFDNLGLTKRNADYMFRFNKALEDTKLTPEKKAAAVQEMVNELVEGQKSGKTAKNLYGDIASRVAYVVDGPKREAETKVFGGPDYWPNMAYNALTFFMIFTLLFGVMYLFSPKLMQTSSPVGITAILVSALIAGFLLPVMPKLFDPKIKHRFNGWIRFLFTLLGFAVWMVLFYFAQLLPKAINPVLMPWPSIIVGLLSIAGMVWLRRRYNIRGGFFG